MIAVFAIHTVGRIAEKQDRRIPQEDRRKQRFSQGSAPRQDFVNRIQQADKQTEHKKRPRKRKHPIVGKHADRVRADAAEKLENRNGIGRDMLVQIVHADQRHAVSERVNPRFCIQIIADARHADGNKRKQKIYARRRQIVVILKQEIPHAF